MTKEDIRQFEDVLQSVPQERLTLFIATTRLLLECCKPKAKLSALLLVRVPDKEDWSLHISGLNIDADDAFEMVDFAYNQLAAAISTEAPERGRFN